MKKRSTTVVVVKNNSYNDIYGNVCFAGSVIL